MVVDKCIDIQSKTLGFVDVHEILYENDSSRGRLKGATIDPRSAVLQQCWRFLLRQHCIDARSIRGKGALVFPQSAATLLRSCRQTATKDSTVIEFVHLQPEWRSSVVLVCLCVRPICSNFALVCLSYCLSVCASGHHRQARARRTF